MQVRHDENLRLRLSNLTNLAEILNSRHRAGKSITPVMWSAFSQRTNEARALLDALGPAGVCSEQHRRDYAGDVPSHADRSLTFLSMSDFRRYQ
jgi:hypothetical protein